ncbi:MAG: peptidylprolyl isomerase [Gammaproteobacteria bacterium]|nr:peptidylprolyl isomerase [Gammaproteobacteria bacterium]
MHTSMGTISLELYPDKAPITVNNFVRNANAKKFDGTVFHRVIKGFMIQGGGMTADMKEQPTFEPITNEANNGLKNEPGAIAMARTMDPHSAASQFFINTANNVSLNHRDMSMRGWGYAVFGKVTKGMDVVKKIESVQTGTHGMHGDVPLMPITIKKVVIVDTGKKKNQE